MEMFLTRRGDLFLPFLAQYALVGNMSIRRLNIEKTGFVKHPCDTYKYHPFISPCKKSQ